MSTKLALVDLLKDEDLQEIVNSKYMLDTTRKVAQEELDSRRLKNASK